MEEFQDNIYFGVKRALEDFQSFPRKLVSAVYLKSIVLENNANCYFKKKSELITSLELVPRFLSLQTIFFSTTLTSLPYTKNMSFAIDGFTVICCILFKS